MTAKWLFLLSAAGSLVIGVPCERDSECPAYLYCSMGNCTACGGCLQNRTSPSCQQRCQCGAHIDCLSVEGNGASSLYCGGNNGFFTCLPCGSPSCTLSTSVNGDCKVCDTQTVACKAHSDCSSGSYCGYDHQCHHCSLCYNQFSIGSDTVYSTLSPAATCPDTCREVPPQQLRWSPRFIWIPNGTATEYTFFWSSKTTPLNNLTSDLTEFHQCDTMLKKDTSGAPVTLVVCSVESAPLCTVVDRFYLIKFNTTPVYKGVGLLPGSNTNCDTSGYDGVRVLALNVDNHWNSILLVLLIGVGSACCIGLTLGVVCYFACGKYRSRHHRQLELADVEMPDADDIATLHDDSPRGHTTSALR